MPQEQTTERYDGFLSFEAGVNTNLAPYLLPKNQLGNAVNVSMRGTFVIPRPPIRQIAVASPFPPDALFQGACYYKPDVGLESLVVQIGGRLFEIIPSTTDNTASITEITIPGDPNDSQLPQAWAWQAEKWVLVNNGSDSPVFYTRNPAGNDPNTRRSLQYAQPINSVGASLVATGPGTTVIATMAMPWTQGNNVPIVISNSPEGNLISNPQTYVFTASPVSGSILTLKNITGVPGKTVAPGQPITKRITSTLPPASFETQLIKNATPNALVPGLGTLENLISGNVEALALDGVIPGLGDLLFGSSSGPTTYTYSITLGTSAQNSTGGFIVPAIGGTVSVPLQSPFLGTSKPGDYLVNLSTSKTPTKVFIGTYQYEVVSINNNISNDVYLTQATETVVPAAGTTIAQGTLVYPQVLGNEIPAGRMGTYGMGQNWFSLPNGISFASGDIVGSSSGTVPYNFRDSVLKFTQNSYLATGGSFSVPGAIGQIQALAFISNLDVSLGQGPLQVATTDVVFSSSTQVTLEASGGTWDSVTNPILTESLIANGSVSQWSTVTSNGDLWFRSPDGWRSLILGRRDFNTWGNVPSSIEVTQYLQNDNAALLNFASAIVFDNRLLGTAGPTSGPLGVYHIGLVALNFDPLASLQGKKPSVWEGAWTGLNVLQLVTGKFSSVPRAFAFNYNTTENVIELWEIMSSTTPAVNATTSIIDLPPMTFGATDPRQREWKKLEDGELFFDQIDSPVQVTAYYRPDYDSRYQLWNSFTIPAAPNYQPRCGLDKPMRTFDTPSAQGGTGRSFAFGFHFQVRLVITGVSWRLMGGRFMASKQQQPQFAPMLPKTPPS